MPEKHDDMFYYKEDKAAVKIGEDNAPSEDPKKRQEFLQQKQSDWDHQDEQERIEFKTERLYQLLKQEGIIGADESAEEYDKVYQYIAYGKESKNPEDKTFFEKMTEIQKRDTAGEWGTFTVGQPIEKVKKTK